MHFQAIIHRWNLKAPVLHQDLSCLVKQSSRNISRVCQNIRSTKIFNLIEMSPFFRVTQLAISVYNPFIRRISYSEWLHDGFKIILRWCVITVSVDWLIIIVALATTGNATIIRFVTLFYFNRKPQGYLCELSPYPNEFLYYNDFINNWITT